MNPEVKSYDWMVLCSRLQMQVYLIKSVFSITVASMNIVFLVANIIEKRWLTASVCLSVASVVGFVAVCDIIKFRYWSHTLKLVKQVTEAKNDSQMEHALDQILAHIGKARP